MKSDPQRMARILRDGFEIWKSHQPKKPKFGRQLSQFCFVNDLPYKLVSKWMSRGLRYSHPDSDDALRRLCDLLNVKYADLWEVPTVSLSVDDVAQAIRLLSELQAVLQKAVDGTKPKRKENPRSKIMDQLAGGAISVEEAQQQLQKKR